MKWPDTRPYITNEKQINCSFTAVCNLPKEDVRIGLAPSICVCCRESSDTLLFQICVNCIKTTIMNNRQLHKELQEIRPVIRYAREQAVKVLQLHIRKLLYKKQFEIEIVQFLRNLSQK